MPERSMAVFFGWALAACGFVLAVAGALTLRNQPPTESLDLLRVRMQVAFGAALIVGGPIGGYVVERRTRR